jgi:hypothetical protein
MLNVYYVRVEVPKTGKKRDVQRHHVVATTLQAGLQKVEEFYKPTRIRVTQIVDDGMKVIV